MNRTIFPPIQFGLFPGRIRPHRSKISPFEPQEAVFAGHLAGLLSQLPNPATILCMDTIEDEKRLVFESLVVEHHVRVRALVRSLGVDPDWVDDIAQEAFLTAYRRWDTYDPSRDFGKWLRGIAANIVRNEIRKDARRQRILHTELAEILLDRYAESQKRYEPLAVVAIQQCVDKLPPKSRQVVQGRYRDGLAAPQLAKQLELSAANVRQMLVRIRRQLKECVELQMLKEASHG